LSSGSAGIRRHELNCCGPARAGSGPRQLRFEPAFEQRAATPASASALPARRGLRTVR